MKPPPAECPVCGEPVPPTARACPHCGADERSGWNEEETRYDGLDLPDNAFEESSASGPTGRNVGRRSLLWLVVALIALVAFLALLLR